MSDLASFAILVGASVFAAHTGYWVGRVRESNRWWPEVDYLRQENARQALMLKLMPKDEVKP